LEEDDKGSKRIKIEQKPIVGFLDVDKIGTFQPNHDAFMVTLRIGGLDMKRVIVDHGSRAEIMCPDLYKWLKSMLKE